MVQNLLLFAAIVGVFVGLFVWAKKRRKLNEMFGNVIDVPRGGGKHRDEREDRD